MPAVYPTGAPVPQSAVGWDGNDFRVIRVDAGHRLVVRGEDQLFSFQGPLQVASSGAISGADGYREVPGPAMGDVWVVTTMMARNDTTPVTEIRMCTWDAPARWEFDAQVRAFAISERAIWGGHVYLESGDSIRAYYVGGLVGDACVVALNGYIMTREV